MSYLAGGIAKIIDGDKTIKVEACDDDIDPQKPSKKRQKFEKNTDLEGINAPYDGIEAEAIKIVVRDINETDIKDDNNDAADEILEVTKNDNTNLNVDDYDVDYDHAHALKQGQ